MSVEDDLEWLRQRAAAQAAPQAGSGTEADLEWLRQRAGVSADPTWKDRAQAAAAAVNRFALADAPGFPGDMALNLVDLAKAGAGRAAGALGLPPQYLPNVTADRSRVPLTSDWMAKQWEKFGVGMTPNRPDDEASRYLYGGTRIAANALAARGARPGPVQPVQAARDAGMGFAAGAAQQGAADAFPDEPAWSVLAGFSPQIAAMTPQALARGFVRGGSAAGERMRSRLDTLNDAGITEPSVGLASGTRRAQWLDSILSKLPGSQGVYARNAEQAQAQLQARAQGIRDDLSGDFTPQTAGQLFQDAVRGEYKDKFGRIWNKKNDRVTDYIDQAVQNRIGAGYDERFPVPNTLAAAARITAPIPGADNVSRLLQTPRMPAINEALQADAAGGLRYRAISGLSTKIGAEAANRAIMGTPEQGDFKQLYGALARDKELAAAASGDPRAVPALKSANEFYSAGRAQIDRLGKIVGVEGSITPEYTFKAVANAIQNQPTLAAKFYSSVRGPVRDALTATVIDHLGTAKGNNQNSTGTEFSSQTFLTNWAKLPDASKAVILRPGVRRDLQTVADAAEMVKRNNVVPNPSGSATTYVNMAALGAAGSAITGGVASGNTLWGLGGAVGVGALVGGANLTARMLTNPTVVHWLARATEMPAERMPQHLTRLAINARTIDDDQTRAEVFDFIKRIGGAR